jgi:hypothetical protein
VLIYMFNQDTHLLRRPDGIHRQVGVRFTRLFVPLPPYPQSPMLAAMVLSVLELPLLLSEALLLQLLI